MTPRTIRTLLASAGALLLAAVVPALAAGPSAAATPSAAQAVAHPLFVRGHAAPGFIQPFATPSGYGPSSLQSAYKLPSSSAGSGQTVAIVDAYNDPNAEADLAVYRSQYGLPACTSASGCFKRVSQTGSTTSLPATDAGWATEESLDLDMVSAICPNCHIILVEATTASFANLGAAVNEAVALGAKEVSNSYGGSDTADASAPYYNHSGVMITASSGDGGYGVEFPASSHYVTAVGGTSLKTASNSRGWTETAWSGAGSGCSTKNPALTGASSFGTGCSKRAVADVSAVADPNTGVAVYDSTPYGGSSGWQVYGGTSVASPIIAAVYALAGNASTATNNYPYAHSTSFFDVTSGSNGTCSPTQLCKARTGWDGPTGLGTPNGVGGF